MSTATKQAEKMEQTKLRPFHETIVDAIEHLWSSDEAVVLAGLIKGTKIPKDHDKIAATWKRKLGEFGQSEDCLDVPASLLAQKQVAEAERTTDLASSFNANGKERALMIVIEKFIDTLKTGGMHYSAQGKRELIFRLFETAKKISRAEDEEELQATIADL